MTYGLFGSDYGIVFFGAVLYGAAHVGVGLWRRARYVFHSPERKAVAHAEAAWVTLLRALALVANADGLADESEIETIGQVYARIVGKRASKGQIREIVARVGTGDDAPGELVASLGLQAPPEHRVLIGRACYLVITSAGQGINPAEERMFELVLEALEVPRAAVLDVPDTPSAPPRTAA